MGVPLTITRLARSRFYYHLARLTRVDPHQELKRSITQIFMANNSRNGHRCIHIELGRRGWRVAKKTVLKLMRALKLVCKTRSRKRFTSY